MVQVDGAGSDGLVGPGVACWVGITVGRLTPGREGMSAWRFAIETSPSSLRHPELFPPCPFEAEIIYPVAFPHIHAYYTGTFTDYHSHMKV